MLLLYQTNENKKKTIHILEIWMHFDLFCCISLDEDISISMASSVWFWSLLFKKKRQSKQIWYCYYRSYVLQHKYIFTCVFQLIQYLQWFVLFRYFFCKIWQQISKNLEKFQKIIKQYLSMIAWIWLLSSTSFLNAFAINIYCIFFFWRMNGLRPVLLHLFRWACTIGLIWIIAVPK